MSRVLARAAAAVGLLVLSGCADSGSEGEEELEAQTSELAQGSALAWDPVAAPGPEYAASRASLLSRCKTFSATLEQTAPVARFADEGLPSTDPARVASAKVWGALEDAAPAVGLCARIDGPDRATSRASLMRASARWFSTYRGGGSDTKTDNDDPGNPINERHILPLVYVWDMVWPSLTSAERTQVKTFLAALDQRVAAFMGGLRVTDTRRINNWNMDALTLRAVAALVRTSRAATAVGAFASFVESTFTQPAGRALSSCANLRAIGAWGGTDLQERDAFTYHMKAVGTAAELAALAPGTLGGAPLARLRDALLVTKPYVSGSKRHVEFACSEVPYDAERRAAAKDWDPVSAKVDFRFARLVFPAQRAWLGAFDGTDYSAWLKVLASGRGDRVIP